MIILQDRKITRAYARSQSDAHGGCGMTILQDSKIARVAARSQSTVHGGTV